MSPFLVRRIRGPVFLLCFALTAILWQWYGVSFARSWPVYLLAAGLLRLGEATLPWSAVPYGTPPVRRASITGALIELAVGVIALLVTIGALPFASLWSVYGRWWPLLLILLGVFLLLERVFDRRSAGALAPRPRRSGLVFLVLLLAALGIISAGTRHFPFDTDPWHGGNWGWNWDGDGETHKNDVTLSEPIAADGSLAIRNARGDVEIAPSEDGRIHVDAHQTLHGPDRGKDRAFAATRPTLRVLGNTATLSVPGRDGVDVKLVVRVPDTLLCTVRTHHGDVAASGLGRALAIEEDHGDVTLDSIGAPVQLRMDHGDVRAHALGADLAIGGRADDVTLTGVRGQTTLDGEFFGDTEISEAGGPVSFHSNRTELRLPRLSGSLSLDGENLSVDGAPEGLRIETRSKDIQITGLSGAAAIHNGNGDMAVALADPLGAVSLADDNGNITLTLPPGANCSLHGSTGESGEIESAFALAQSSAGGRKTIAGQVGKGGPTVTLNTQHGDLSLRRGAAGAGESERRLHSRGERPAPVVM